MIVVTGGMGFIGSNIIRALNLENINDILVVDDLTDGIKFRNLLNCQILDYEDKDSFLTKILKNEFSKEKIMQFCKIPFIILLPMPQFSF